MRSLISLLALILALLAAQTLAAPGKAATTESHHYTSTVTIYTTTIAPTKPSPHQPSTTTTQPVLPPRPLRPLRLTQLHHHAWRLVIRLEWVIIVRITVLGSRRGWGALILRLGVQGVGSEFGV